MPKLNYVNRKSEGVKLGQIVAKDLRKRLKATAHKDVSPLELLLDNKSLTDEGLAEVARGLEDIVCRPSSTERSNLAVLNLTGNSLTSQSLFEVAGVIRASTDHLQEVNLSLNAISIFTEDDHRNWRIFLESLRYCKSLKVLNLSGNDLHCGRAWEILAKAFNVHFHDNSAVFETLMDEADSLEDNFVASIQSLVIKTHKDNDEMDLPTPPRVSGLQAIGAIHVENVNLTDAGSLWLSFCLGKERWVQDRLKAGQVQSASHNPSGIIYANDRLSTTGQKLLRHAETLVYDPLATTPRVPENSPMTSRQGSLDIVQTRQASNASYHHRRTSMSSESPDNDKHPSSHFSASIAEMESLRRKLQRTMLEEEGPKAAQIWHAAIQLLVHARRILPKLTSKVDLPASGRSPSHAAPPEPLVAVLPTIPPTPRTPSLSPSRPNETYASKLVVDNAELNGPVLSIVGSSEIPATPQIFRHPRARHENFSYHSNSSSPASKINGSARAAVLKAAIHMTDAEPEMIGRLPINALVTILTMLCDPHGALSERQVKNVIHWGRDRETLATEAEVLGKPGSVQMWRVLDGMGCLSYDE